MVFYTERYTAVTLGCDWGGGLSQNADSLLLYDMALGLRVWAQVLGFRPGSGDGSDLATSSNPQGNPNLPWLYVAHAPDSQNNYRKPRAPRHLVQSDIAGKIFSHTSFSLGPNMLTVKVP